VGCPASARQATPYALRRRGLLAKWERRHSKQRRDEYSKPPPRIQSIALFSHVRNTASRHWTPIVLNKGDTPTAR